MLQLDAVFDLRSQPAAFREPLQVRILEIHPVTSSQVFGALNINPATVIPLSGSSRSSRPGELATNKSLFWVIQNYISDLPYCFIVNF